MRVEERLARRGGLVELLRPIAAVYGAVVTLHGKLHDRRILPHARVEAPVVSVGNLTVGGTGKTPMVVHIARELARRELRVGVLSRGYSRDGAPQSGAAPKLNDEGRLLAQLLPGVPQVQRADRISGGRELIERGCDVIVLDDGFQHRRLERDLDLVLVDATRPWGLAAEEGSEAVKSILPRGLLRERPSALGRADALVLTRCDQVSKEELAKLEAALEKDALGVPRLLAEHRPARLVKVGSRAAESLDSLQGAEVQLLSAIGNPAAFQSSVEALGARVLAHYIQPDHHEWTAADLAAVHENSSRVITTAKDAVKLEALGSATANFEVLEIELAITRGEPVLTALLDRLPESKASRERRNLHEGLHG